jgi:hypothetical protein
MNSVRVVGLRVEIQGQGQMETGEGCGFGKSKNATILLAIVLKIGQKENHVCMFERMQNESRPRCDSNAQSPEPKSGALAIGPRGLVTNDVR